MVSLSSRRRTRVFGAATAALVIGGFALAGPSSGRMMAVPVDGSGSVTCSVTGTLGFNPPLVAGGTATTETVTLKAHLKSCTGTGNGANVKAGTAVVSGTTATNDCLTVLTTAPTGARSGPLRWTVLPHTPHLNPSTIRFDTLAHSEGPPITVDSGGSSTAGSFAGDAAAAHTVIKPAFKAIAGHCVNAHGLKALPFAPGSTFSLTAPSPPA